MTTVFGDGKMHLCKIDVMIESEVFFFVLAPQEVMESLF